MRIVQLTVGTGTQYLGSTVRDQSLCSALRRMGHQIHFVRLWDDMLVEDEEYWRYAVAFNCKLTLTAHTSWIYRTFGNLLPKNIVRSIGARAYDAFYGQPCAERMETIFEFDDQWGEVFQEEVDELVKTLRSCRPHLLLVTGFPPWKVIKLVRDQVDAPMVMTLNGTFFDLLDRGVDKAHLKAALETPDGIISPSQYLLDEVTTTLQLKPLRARVIPRGFMLNFYSAREIAPPQPSIGYLGGMASRNGFEKLVQAVYALRKKGHRFTFVILSGATAAERAILDDRLGAFSDENCTYRCLQYLPIEEKTKMMEQLSVLALPGIRKAFGNPVAEAMAAGIPVVQPNAGPYPEIIRDGETGLLYDPDDDDGLANALERLITDRDLNKRLGHGARAEAVNQFSSERMTGELLDFVKEFVPGAG